MSKSPYFPHISLNSCGMAVIKFHFPWSRFVADPLQEVGHCIRAYMDDRALSLCVVIFGKGTRKLKHPFTQPLPAMLRLPLPTRKNHYQHPTHHQNHQNKINHSHPIEKRRKCWIDD